MNMTKSKYCAGLQCPKILWMQQNMPEKFDQAALDESRIETGNAVGELAMGYFGQYEQVPYSPDKNEMITETKRLINSGIKIITEASFAFENNFCSADILRRTEEGFELIEVKSSTASDGDGPDTVKQAYIDDMAYQLYVLTNSGLSVDRVSIMQLNRDYVRNGELDIQSLFVLIDCTERVLEKQEEIQNNIDNIRSLVEQTDEPGEPEIRISSGCIGCGFEGWCMLGLPENNVFEIGWSMWGSKKNDAYNNGFISFEDILNGDVKLTDKQMRQVKTAADNLPPLINKEQIRTFLSTVGYPLYHLDFETYQQPIPLWDNVSPYMQIPFQYSLHIQDAPCGPVTHKEFLGLQGADPRRALTEQLCADIPMNACTMAYNMSFEKSQIKGLARIFPDLRDHLMSIHNNMVDVMVPFQSGAYYCREMGGSYSIKKVLPALFPDDPELNYKALSLIHNGGEAMAAFATLHEKPPHEIAEIRAAMLAYCRLDTLAMVKILEKLYSIAK